MLTKGKTAIGLLSHAVMAAVMVAPPAFAQTAAADEGDGGEIIVTATKRAENLQSVPISVSAIGGDTLARSKMTQADDIVSKVANLQLSSTVGDNTPIFALRGISMSDYSLNQASPVATYYDEVYKGNFALLGVAMYDVERIEVLRGPQGTLYGKNTTGGAVNIISRAPVLGEWNGYANVGYGNYNRVDANGAVNAPLGDKAALRLAGTFSRANGWFKNVEPGKPDVASVREYALRGSLKLEPSDTVSFILRASTSLQNPYNYGIYSQPEDVWRPGLKKDELASNVTARRRARTYSLALTGNIELNDALTLTSITSWDKGNLFFHEDSDGIAAEYLEVSYYARTKQFAQDLRLTSNMGGPFDFILGAYFNREKLFNESVFHIGNDIDLTGDGMVDDSDCVEGLSNADPSDDLVACKIRNSFDQLKKSYALYSDLKYALTDVLTLRGGLRYTHDTGKQSHFVSDALGVNDGFVANFIPSSTLTYKTDNLSGKIGLDYKLPGGNLLYASYSRGYRAPSFNAQAFFDPSELSVAKAEKVNAYEIGAKTQFAGRAVTLNLAAFYYDYRNQQFINLDPDTAAQTLLNIPKSRIYGGEAELSARLTGMLAVRAGIGLLSSKIEKGEVSGVDVAGNKLSNAPGFTFNGGIDLTAFDSEAGKLSFHPEVNYVSSQYFEVINVPELRQKGYAMLGGHVDYESADGRWSVSLWGKNLTDKFYFTSRIDLMSGFGYYYNHRGNPRTYGITVGAKL